MSSEDVYATPSANLSGSGAAGSEQLTPGMFEALGKTKFWVMLFGILMFIGAAFTLLGSLGVILGGATMGAELADAGMGTSTAAMVGLGVIYLLVAVIYAVLGTYLVKYGSRIGQALRSKSAADVESALQTQQSFWKLAGILTLLSIIVMIVMVIGAVAIGVMAGV